MTDSIKETRARMAAQAHESLFRRASTKKGQEGVTRLRARLQEALKARMRAELDAAK